MAAAQGMSTTVAWPGDGPLNCRLCQQFYNSGPNKPLNLQCMHTFCEQCVMGNKMKKKQKASDKLKCPLCKKKTKLEREKVVLLPVNLGIMEMLQQADLAAGGNFQEHSPPEQNQLYQKQMMGQQQRVTFDETSDAMPMQRGGPGQQLNGFDSSMSVTTAAVGSMSIAGPPGGNVTTVNVGKGAPVPHDNRQASSTTSTSVGVAGALGYFDSAPQSQPAAPPPQRSSTTVIEIRDKAKYTIGSSSSSSSSSSASGRMQNYDIAVVQQQIATPPGPPQTNNISNREAQPQAAMSPRQTRSQQVAGGGCNCCQSGQTCSASATSCPTCSANGNCRLSCADCAARTQRIDDIAPEKRPLTDADFVTDLPRQQSEFTYPTPNDDSLRPPPTYFTIDPRNERANDGLYPACSQSSANSGHVYPMTQLYSMAATRPDTIVESLQSSQPLAREKAPGGYPPPGASMYPQQPGFPMQPPRYEEVLRENSAASSYPASYVYPPHASYHLPQSYPDPATNSAAPVSSLYPSTADFPAPSPCPVVQPRSAPAVNFASTDSVPLQLISAPTLLDNDQNLTTSVQSSSSQSMQIVQKFGRYSDISSQPGTFKSPTSVGVAEATGKLLVVDQQNTTIQVFAIAGGECLAMFRVAGLVSACFCTDDGTRVAAASQKGIEIYNLSGTSERLIPIGSSSSPVIAVTAYRPGGGFIAVQSRAISIFKGAIATLSKTVTGRRAAGRAGPISGHSATVSFDSVVAVALTRYQDLLVLDAGAGAIYIVDEDSNLKSTIFPSGEPCGALVKPTSLAIDAANNIIVSDSGNRRVLAFTAAGRFLRSLLEPPGLQPPGSSSSSGSAGDGSLVWPAGIDVALSTNQLFVVARGNQLAEVRLYKL